MSETKKLPKIADLYRDVDSMAQEDTLTALLNQEPHESWVKKHPYIANYKYLPIDRVEFLLKKIFKSYKIEVLREGYAFNGVYVVVRVHYKHPSTGTWYFHDGIGAKELQVKKGTSPADLANINAGALQMAFPIAKTVAIKDACDHFGKLFGSDLNRKDTLSIQEDDYLQGKVRKSKVQEINEALEAEKKAIPTSAVEPVRPVEAQVYIPELVQLQFTAPEIPLGNPASAWDGI